MIIAIGTDIVEVERIGRAITRTPRFVSRVFTEHEQAYCESRGRIVRAQHYAARFAAKEAAFKALGTGWRDGLAWRDVEVIRDEQGAPSLIFNEKAREIFDLSGATRAHLSLSHTQKYAIAFVIFEASENK